MDANSKKLKTMATWTIAVFATVFAVFMSLFWLLNYELGVTAWKVLLAAFATGWPIFLITAVLCLVIYFSYNYYLVHKK
jgi:hypothetical protein